MLNNFFTNIGSKLSKDIIVPANVTISDYLKHRNNQNLLLTPISEEEVIGVVRLWESETSTDYEDTNMELIKRLLILLRNQLLIFVTYHSVWEYFVNKK